MNANLNLNDLYPSRYLKTSDVGDNGLILTIKNVSIEELGFGDRLEKKPVVAFEETTKLFIVNRTNGSTIAQLHGARVSDWVGKRIALYTTEVAFQGATMLGIRVRLRVPSQPQYQGPPEPPDPWA